MVSPLWWSWSWDGVKQVSFVERLDGDGRFMEVVIDLMFESSSAWKRTAIWSGGLNKQVTSKKQGCSSLSRFLAGRAHH